MWKIGRVLIAGVILVGPASLWAEPPLCKTVDLKIHSLGRHWSVAFVDDAITDQLRNMVADDYARILGPSESELRLDNTGSAKAFRICGKLFEATQRISCKGCVQWYLPRALRSGRFGYVVPWISSDGGHQLAVVVSKATIDEYRKHIGTERIATGAARFVGDWNAGVFKNREPQNIVYPLAENPKLTSEEVRKYVAELLKYKLGIPSRLDYFEMTDSGRQLPCYKTSLIVNGTGQPVRIGGAVCMVNGFWRVPIGAPE
jgi:hypothetical protein